MTTLSKRTGNLIGCVGHDCDDCKKQKRDTRNLRTNLKALTDQVMRHLVWLDAEMKKPESPERGKQIAKLANVLEVANDAALVEKLKAETYAFSGTLTVAQVLGCFQIAAHEILDEQT